MRLGELAADQNSMNKEKYFIPALSLVTTVIVMPAHLHAYIHTLQAFTHTREYIHFISQIQNLLLPLNIKHVNKTHTKRQ
jgi:hypothetical protein